MEVEQEEEPASSASPPPRYYAKRSQKPPVSKVTGEDAEGDDDEEEEGAEDGEAPPENEEEEEEEEDDDGASSTLGSVQSAASLSTRMGGNKMLTPKPALKGKPKLYQAGAVPLTCAEYLAWKEGIIKENQDLVNSVRANNNSAHTANASMRQ